MTYEILIGALGLIGLLAGVVKPLINLNQNITTLTMSVNQLRDILTELKERVTTHGREMLHSIFKIVPSRMQSQVYHSPIYW